MYIEIAHETTASKSLIFACKTQQHQEDFHITVTFVTIAKTNYHAPALKSALTVVASLTQPACLITNQIKAGKLENT